MTTFAPNSSGSRAVLDAPGRSPMTPDHANSSKPPKTTGRLRRLATKAALTVMQITFGAACLIGTFWGVTQFLAGDFEPLFAGAAEPIAAGASAPQFAGPALSATQAVAEMPEIKSGVPERMPIRAAALATSAHAGHLPAAPKDLPAQVNVPP